MVQVRGGGGVQKERRERENQREQKEGEKEELRNVRADVCRKSEARFSFISEW